MDPMEYIKALDCLQSACAGMFVKADKFKHIHLLVRSNEIYDRDEWGASVNDLAEGINKLKESLNEACKLFYIKTGGQ